MAPLVLGHVRCFGSAGRLTHYVQLTPAQLALCKPWEAERYYSKPINLAASATDLRSETTALAGNVSSGQPSAMLFMIT